MRQIGGVKLSFARVGGIGLSVENHAASNSQMFFLDPASHLAAPM